ADSTESIPSSSAQKYSCQGKVHCSEMTSCEEATFYVQNCPGTKMDGDGDGKPCEDRCGH
uniref:excalibur calcium-binding domain-containing protein n=1 Tax=Candidatus Electronema sp. TaxID=2698783 RepID=UPI00405742FB